MKLWALTLLFSVFEIVVLGWTLPAVMGAC